MVAGILAAEMGKVRTFRFHAEYGPARLFEEAYEQLNSLAGLSLLIPHANSRVHERQIPLQYLTDFRPGCWEVMTVELTVRTGRIAYMSLRSEIEARNYLWIVLAHEHVITAWIDRKARTRATHPQIVKDGPAWEAAAAGCWQEKTRAQVEWEEAWMRRARAQEVLDALSSSPDRPRGDRLAYAMRLVLAGATWSEAAAGAGWDTRSGLKAAIGRLLRAVDREKAKQTRQVTQAGMTNPGAAEEAR